MYINTRNKFSKEASDLLLATVNCIVKQALVRIVNAVSLVIPPHVYYIFRLESRKQKLYIKELNKFLEILCVTISMNPMIFSNFY